MARDALFDPVGALLDPVGALRLVYCSKGPKATRAPISTRSCASSSTRRSSRQYGSTIAGQTSPLLDAPIVRVQEVSRMADAAGVNLGTEWSLREPPQDHPSSLV